MPTVTVMGGGAMAALARALGGAAASPAKMSKKDAGKKDTLEKKEGGDGDTKEGEEGEEKTEEQKAAEKAAKESGEDDDDDDDDDDEAEGAEGAAAKKEEDAGDVPLNKILWMFETGDGWLPHEPKVSEALERAKRDGKLEVSMHIGGEPYTCRLAPAADGSTEDPMQTSGSGGEAKRLRRHVLSDDPLVAQFETLSVKYAPPTGLFGQAVLTTIEKVWSSGESFRGKENGFGFLFLYGLLQGDIKAKLVGGGGGGYGGGGGLYSGGGMGAGGGGMGVYGPIGPMGPGGYGGGGGGGGGWDDDMMGGGGMGGGGGGKDAGVGGGLDDMMGGGGGGFAGGWPMGFGGYGGGMGGGGGGKRGNDSHRRALPPLLASDGYAWWLRAPFLTCHVVYVCVFSGSRCC